MAGGSKNPLKGRIRDVWRGNLAQEMQVLRSLIDKYPYISMVRWSSSAVERMVMKHGLIVKSRIPSSRESSRGQWVHSRRKPTIITKP